MILDVSFEGQLTVRDSTNQVPLLGKIGGKSGHNTAYMHGNNTDKYRFDLLRSEQWMATGAEEWDSELRQSAGVSCSSVYPVDSPKLGIVLTVYSGVCYSFD